MPGPPVARMVSTFGCCIRYCESVTLGCSIQPIMSFGAPALTASSSIMRAVSTVHFLARGCGEKIMPLRVFRASRVLKMVVDVGLVVGIMPAITPMGSPTFIMPFSGSSSSTPQVLVFLYLL